MDPKQVVATFHPAVRGWFEGEFASPTECQAGAWPSIRARRHTLVAAPTGSGKTLAAFLAAIDDLVRQGLGERDSSGLDTDSAPIDGGAAGLIDETQVLYISPLKALSNDIQRNLQKPLEGIQARLRSMGFPEVPIRVLVRTGDTPAAEREAMKRRPPHIVVTTPESLFILLTSEGGRNLLRTVRTLIVDEIHALVADKRGSHLALSLERLEALVAGHAGAGARRQASAGPVVPGGASAIPGDLRTAPDGGPEIVGEGSFERRGLVRIGLSATQKPIEEVARFLVGAAMVDAEGAPACTIVDAGHARDLDLAIEVPGSPLQAVMPHEIWSEVYDRLAALIRAHRTTLVFVNTRRLSERVARHLGERLGEARVASHHGSLAREQRFAAEQRLKSGGLSALVATASLELGIDVGDIDLVCQIGSTRSIATLLQRVGRSGHAVRAFPKGRIFPTSRDELVEAAALLDSVRRRELDRIRIPDRPLDILAQQIVAATACEEWSEDDLFDLVRRAWPYRALPRAEHDAVVGMLAGGFTTRRGRRGALVHRDGINHRLRGRRGARLAAITSGGAIPDTADYEVVAEPAGARVGTVNEDFAIESTAGEIFQLGNSSWRILRIEPGRLRVEDARGAPPTIPFWLGEAPSRSAELSFSVSRLRETLDGLLGTDRTIASGSGATNGARATRDAVGPIAESIDRRGYDATGPASSEDPSGDETTHPPSTGGRTASAEVDGGSRTLAWLESEIGIAPEAATQIVDYLAAARGALGVLPTQRTIVLERFFDETGGMQLVVHAPFGSRINRAWGLSLRKRFCQRFNFELQAAATEDAIVLSLGPGYSFPLAEVADYLRASSVRPLLVQALLDAPMFAIRWRWNVSRSLAVPRWRGGRKLAPQLQRIEAEDLLAAAFPDQLACVENTGGRREIPDHPLVEQTIRDCLLEAMDVAGLETLLASIERGETRIVARDLTEPSPLAAEILNARPYAFLDDAPLEERRTQAVMGRRWLDPETASDLGALDPAAIARVREEAWPEVRSADELHDALLLLGFITEEEGRAGQEAMRGSRPVSNGEETGIRAAPSSDARRPAPETAFGSTSNSRDPGGAGHEIGYSSRPSSADPGAAVHVAGPASGFDSAEPHAAAQIVDGPLAAGSRGPIDARHEADAGWTTLLEELIADGRAAVVRLSLAAPRDQAPPSAEPETVSVSPTDHDREPAFEETVRTATALWVATERMAEIGAVLPGASIDPPTDRTTLPAPLPPTPSLSSPTTSHTPSLSDPTTSHTPSLSNPTTSPSRRATSLPRSALSASLGSVTAGATEDRLGRGEEKTRPSASQGSSPSADKALVEILRGRLDALGPVTARGLAGSAAFRLAAVEAALARLESDGFAMRGRFTPGAPGEEWCARRLLARIHRYTIGRLRQEIEPVAASDFVRFLARWQRVEPQHRAAGPEALRGVVEQLEGFEAAAGSWESEILPSRIEDYEGSSLDALCLAGRIVWARLSPARPGPSSAGRAGPVRTTPIALLGRASLSVWSSFRPSADEGPLDRRAATAKDASLLPGESDRASLSDGARAVLERLATRGASFFDDLASGTELLRTQLELALGELVARGLVTSDSFAGLRALLVPAAKRPPIATTRRRRKDALHGMESAGRWSLLPAGEALIGALDRRPTDPGPSRGSDRDAEPSGARSAETIARSDASRSIETIARTLLRRWGVVFRRVLDREALAVPWRDLLREYRRLEARGEIRGGRFVEGFWGEQFAIPDAVGLLRSIRREPRAGAWVSVSAADPLNVIGVLTPGPRLPSAAGNRVLYRDGLPVAIREAGEIRFLVEMDRAAEWEAHGVLVRGTGALLSDTRPGRTA